MGTDLPKNVKMLHVQVIPRSTDEPKNVINDISDSFGGKTMRSCKKTEKEDFI